MQKDKTLEASSHIKTNFSKLQSHDLFFKRFFSTVRRVLELLRVILPKRILDLFDLKTLQIEKDVFVKDLEMRVDLVLTVMFKNFRHPAKIILLLDHKSFLDREVFKKLLKYQAMAYTKYDYPVFAIIFYHGKKKWTLPKNFHEYLVSRDYLPKEALKELSSYLIDFTPYIFDLSKFDVDNQGRESIKPILYAFQHIWSLDGGKSSKERYEFLQRFFSLTKKLSKSHKKGYIIDVIADVVTYFYQYNPKLDKKVLQGVSQEMTKKLGGTDIMEAYDFTIKGALQRGEKKGLEKGLEKGLQKGVEKGLQQGIQEVAVNLLKADMSIEHISHLTGLSKVKIRKLKAEITSHNNTDGTDIMEAYDFTIKGALQRGEKKGIQEVALNLLKADMSIEHISHFTGLSKVEIRKLKAEITSNNNADGTDIMEAYDFTIKGALQRGEKKGLEKGLQQGLQKGVRKIALKLLKLDMDTKKISQVTGLSQEEIRKLQAKVKK